MPGDYATVEADGSITLLGRGSIVINSGGEKIFPEEVESAVRSHPDVMDAIVCGAPDERWGQTVAAIIQPRVGHEAPSLESMQEHCRESIAGYKLPRRLHVVDAVERSPSGKPDYTWAAAIVNAGRSPGPRFDTVQHPNAPCARTAVLDTQVAGRSTSQRHSRASNGYLGTIPPVQHPSRTPRPAHRRSAARRAGHDRLCRDQPALLEHRCRRSDRARRPPAAQSGPRRTSTPRRRGPSTTATRSDPGVDTSGVSFSSATHGVDLAGARRAGLRGAARGHRARLRRDRERHDLCAGRQHRRRPVVQPRRDTGPVR